MNDKKIMFAQPFSIDGCGGGSKIIRSLVDSAPIPYVSVCSSPQVDVSTNRPELHIPNRPSLMRLESTRFATRLGNVLSRIYEPTSRRRLEAVAREHQVTHAHVVAHGPEFLSSFDSLASMGIDMTLTIHDDFGYTIKDPVRLQLAYDALGAAWKRADRRIVISEEMGMHYQSQFSNLPYDTITDSLEAVGEPISLVQQRRGTIYFMGMLHLSYLANFEWLSLATAQLDDQRYQLVVRGGQFDIPDNGHVPQFLPFVSGDLADRTVEADIKGSHLLYLPLPFESEHDDFTKYSLSTKMITYCGSGIPILYHGPAYSAAAQLLARHNACIAVTEPGVQPLLDRLSSLTDSEAHSVAKGSIELAREKFVADDVVDRFWNYYTACGSGVAQMQNAG